METPTRTGWWFTAEPLVIEDGHVRAVLWENLPVGLQRGVFWRAAMYFREVHYEGELVRPSLTVDWLRIPLRDWRDLPGQWMAGERHDEGVEATFTLGGELVPAEYSVAFIDRRGTELRVRTTVSFPYPTEKGPNRIVQAEAWLPFWGLLVPADLAGATSPADALDVAARWVDLRGHVLPMDKRYLRPSAE